MRRLLTVIIAVAMLAGMAGCKKEETISDKPEIKFVSMSPGTARKYVDEVKVTISYTDGNGDLGENTPDVKNLFCTDSRNNVTYQFRINQLAPDEANIIIQGEISFNLPPQGFADDNNTSEMATYSVYVKDRAGNISNTIQTPALTINK